MTEAASGAGILGVMGITSMPATFMAFGSLAVNLSEPSERMQARMQHLSAGLLIGAVITEIFPILKARLSGTEDRAKISWVDLGAALIGFTAALILMYGLKAMDGDEEEDEHAKKPSPSNQVPLLRDEAFSSAVQPSAEKESSSIWFQSAAEEESGKLNMAFARLQAHSSALSRLVEKDEVDREAVDEEVHGIDFLVDSVRRLCRGAEPIDTRNAARLRYHVDVLIHDVEKLKKIDPVQTSAIDGQLRSTAATLRHIHLHAERGTFRRWGPRPLHKGEEAEEEQEGALPKGIICAVVVDSAVDGMLIGLAASVASASGWLMAIATSMEMGFLGYSFACEIRKARRSGCLPKLITFAPPVCMILSSALSAASTSVAENTPIFSGLVAFAMVALLFLVLQELLVEAHEKEENEVWHVGVFLYVGLLLSIGFDMGLS